MKNITVFTVVGARPQFIKAAVVSRAFRSHHSGVREILVHTGQHYDSNMSDIFFDELDIPKPDYNLGIGGGSHGQNTGRMLEKIENLLIVEKPDWVLVYGDTDSTLAGALAASKLHIPVVHVESGLRSYNRRMPEEINRILTDHVSTVLFCPTSDAKLNLQREGISLDKIHVVGDVMYDAAIFYKNLARMPAWFIDSGMEIGSFILCTVHRAENTDDMDRMRNIFDGLASSEIPVILPLHPRTRARLQNMGLSIPDNIKIFEPVGYPEMVWLEINCRLIATDSGGVQKEAYFHKKPCITLRDETEWVELVTMKVNDLVGVSPRKIRNSLQRSWIDGAFDNMEVYGCGDSGEIIATYLASNTK